MMFTVMPERVHWRWQIIYSRSQSLRMILPSPLTASHGASPFAPSHGLFMAPEIKPFWHFLGLFKLPNLCPYTYRTPSFLETKPPWWRSLHRGWRTSTRSAAPWAASAKYSWPSAAAPSRPRTGSPQATAASARPCSLGRGHGDRRSIPRHDPWDCHICRSVGVVPWGSMGRHIWQSHGVSGYIEDVSES